MASTPASVAALLKPKHDVGRNAFPLDHRQVFSIKAGQITPVKCLKFVPNDHFTIDVSEFGITFPMQTAPFLRGRKETVVYTVYNSAVWSLFNQYIAQRSDPKNSALNANLSEPRMALWDMYAYSIMQLLGYCAYKFGIPLEVKNQYPDADVNQNLPIITRLQSDFLDGDFNNNLIWGSRNFAVDWNTNMYSSFIKHNYGWYNNQVNPNVSQPLMRDFYQDVVGQWRVFNVLRKLDMLGYGNLVPWFKEFIDTVSIWCENIDTSVDNWYSKICSDIVSLINVLIYRVAECSCTFSSYNAQGYPTSGATTTYVYRNLYAICGYNLIFYHMFRNSFYDLNYNPRDYNLDFVSAWSNEGDNDFNVVDISDFSCRFLDIEYHQWKKDLFTGVLPDTQFGAVSSLTFNVNGTVPISGTAVIDGVSGSDLGKYTLYDGSTPSPHSDIKINGSGTSLFSVPDNSSLRHTHSINGTARLQSSGNLSAQGSFDVIALKRAEILQEYRQTLMRAGNKTSDVFRALYGGAPSSEHEDDVIPRFIDTFGHDIFVDPVTATANTEQGSNGTLGDLSARGKFSGNSNKININCGRNFGNIFILTYFVPSSEYNSYFLDPANGALNPQDHYIAAFENMGLEPIYSDELNSLRPRRDLSVIGYAPRYHYLKSQLDVVHGEFVSLPPNLRLMSTFGYGSIYSNPRSLSSGFNGSFNIWVAPRTDMQNRQNTQLRDFYINPSILDNLFIQSTDATQVSDSIICNMYLDIKATRGMSKVGLMNFA